MVSWTLGHKSKNINALMNKSQTTYMVSWTPSLYWDYVPPLTILDLTLLNSKFPPLTMFTHANTRKTLSALLNLFSLVFSLLNKY